MPTLQNRTQWQNFDVGKLAGLASPVSKSATPRRDPDHDSRPFQNVVKPPICGKST